MNKLGERLKVKGEKVKGEKRHGWCVVEYCSSTPEEQKQVGFYFGQPSVFVLYFKFGVSGVDIA